MKTTLLPLLALTLASMGSLTAQSAPAELPCWTSNDNHTIRAKFIGVGTQAVLIEKDGRVFTVLFSRLAPQSIEQARRLGRMIESAAALACPPRVLAESQPIVQAKPAEPPPVIAKPVSPAKLMLTTVKDQVKPMVLAKPVIHRPSLPAITPSLPAYACTLSLAGKTATSTQDVPYTVQRAIEAGNFLQTKPYKWGGGHGSLMDSGYDCSGSVSHVLMQAGLLNSALTSSGFARYGEPGPGKWITIYAGSGHVFMSICGLRLDTGGRGGRGESGPRWCMASRGNAGWTLRHPPGF